MCIKWSIIKGGINRNFVEHMFIKLLSWDDEMMSEPSGSRLDASTVASVVNVFINVWNCSHLSFLVLLAQQLLWLRLGLKCLNNFLFNATFNIWIDTHNFKIIIGDLSYTSI